MLVVAGVIDCHGNKFAVLGEEDVLQEQLNRYRMWSERAAKGLEEHSMPIHLIGRTVIKPHLAVEHVVDSDSLTSMSICEYRLPKRRPKPEPAPEAAPTSN